jgi:GTP-binding protein EngB required for normal cell division
MYKILCLTITVLAVVLVSLPTNGWAQVPATQIQLTEKNVEGFIAAQKDMSALVEKMQGAAFLNQADAKYKAEREAISKKYGFRDFAEYEAITKNISMVMTAIDPQTKEYADPQIAIKKEIDDVRADRTIPNREKKQLLAELNEALKSAPSVQFPTNIELIQKYYDKIDVTTISVNDGEERPSSSVVRTISE